MTRAETMCVETRRVFVWNEVGGALTHSASSHEEKTMRAYYEAVAIAGSRKVLQVRRGGAHRYAVVEMETMSR